MKSRPKPTSTSTITATTATTNQNHHHHQMNGCSITYGERISDQNRIAHLANGYVINCTNSYNNNNNQYCHSNGTTGNIHSSGLANNTTGTSNHSNNQNSCGNRLDNHWYAYVFISCIAIGCYINGMNGDFVHDDIPAITLNKDVIGTNKITRTFFNDFWGTPMDDTNSHKSYRPLTVLSFRFNYYLFGLKPVWFHFTNILMHAIVCVLFTRVCIIVAGLQDNFAIIAGIIFAVHPIHTEAVTGIVGRADILACIFFLVSLLIYHGKLYSSDNLSTWLSIFFGGISMLSKETGITVFLVNLTYDLYRCWPSLKRTVVDVHWTQESQQYYRRLSIVLMSMGILLTVRLALLQGSFPKFSQQDNPTAYHPSFYVRMLTFCYLAAFNWWLVLCPSTLSHDWQMGSIPLLTSISDPRNLLTLWAFASTILMLHKGILDFESQRYAPLILGILLLILPFLPATNLFVTVGFVVAERVLYIPSLGCVLLVVYGAQIMWETMSKYRSFIILMGILLITVGTCKTITRNRDWYSRECLLRAGLKVLPHNAKMHYNFGNFLKDSFQHDMAKQHYREALRLWPTYASAHNNLGTLVNNLDVAENHFLSAILYASTHTNAHFNLGQLYIKKNRTTDAVRMLKRCTEIDGTYVQAHLELFKLHNGINATNVLMNAIASNPDNMELKLTLGYWLLDNGHTPVAINIFQSALQQESNKLVTTGICKCLRKLGQLSRLQLFMSRLQTIYRLSHGGRLYKIDIYLRNWSIRTEIQRRAYLYSIDNKSFHQSELTVSHAQQQQQQQHQQHHRRGEHQNSLTSIAQQSPSDKLMSTVEHVKLSNASTIANVYRNNSDQLLMFRQYNDNKYHKQYCCTKCNYEKTNNIESAMTTEINTTTRKPLSANQNEDATASTSNRRYGDSVSGGRDSGDDDNRRIVHKICNNINTDNGQATATTTVDQKSSIKRTESFSNQQNNNKINANSNNLKSNHNKPPKLRTQNNFLKRLFLIDIMDKI